MKRSMFVAALALAVLPNQSAPTLEGYRLKTPRLSLPRDVPCMSVPYGWACHPTDSISLRFQRDTLFYIGYTVTYAEEDCPPPLREWRARWSAWSQSRFGAPDSVREAPSSNGPNVTAYWSAQGKTAWSAQAGVMTMSRGSTTCFYLFRVFSQSSG